MTEFGKTLLMAVLVTLIATILVAFLNYVFNWAIGDKVRLWFHRNVSKSLEGQSSSLIALTVRDPTNRQHRVELTQILLRSGNFAQAIDAFLPLVSETAHPNHYDVAFLAQLYTQSGRLREAELWAKRALDMVPNDVDYALMYIAILVESGKKGKAISELKQLVQYHYQSVEQFEQSSSLSVIDKNVLAHYQALVKLQHGLILFYEEQEQKRIIKGLQEITEYYSLNFE